MPVKQVTIAEGDWIPEHLRKWIAVCDRQMSRSPVCLFVLRSMFSGVLDEYDRHSDRHIPAQLWQRIHTKLQPAVVALLKRPTSQTLLKQTIVTYLSLWK